MCRLRLNEQKPGSISAFIFAKSSLVYEIRGKAPLLQKGRSVSILVWALVCVSSKKRKKTCGELRGSFKNEREVFLSQFWLGAADNDDVSLHNYHIIYPNQFF